MKGETKLKGTYVMEKNSKHETATLEREPEQESAATIDKRQFADYAGQVAAISKSQAVIEFDMDGTIVTANDNFLNAMGYRLNEIKGRHHSMFVDEDYRRSSEYKDFWARLNRGEYQSGEYKRTGKGGKEVWIQATYNPILDPDGKPFKVVKYATDVTAQKHAEAELQRVMSDATEVMQALAAGDLSKQMTGTYSAQFSTLTGSI